MSIRFYNTLSRKKEAFEPLESGKAGLYTCGPTVYSYVHIGNLRTFLFQDLVHFIHPPEALRTVYPKSVSFPEAKGEG